jgi:hypothetical protein
LGPIATVALKFSPLQQDKRLAEAAVYERGKLPFADREGGDVSLVVKECRGWCVCRLSAFDLLAENRGSVFIGDVSILTHPSVLRGRLQTKKSLIVFH